jgi:tetratricopeptide (TPR) repeat protein
MRDLLAKADLARYAGRFVWLELNYDQPRNQAFMTKFNATATPSFFVIDPRDQRVAAAEQGVMSLAELTQFLERGAAGVTSRKQGPADTALSRGDALLAAQPAEAAEAYQAALRAATANWPRRELAQSALVQALQDSKQLQACAETAASEAASMSRDGLFVRTVVNGLWCLAMTDPSPWADAAVARLKPMAEEALALSTTIRDHRDAIYRTLMYISVTRNDNAAAAKWGDRWLAELDRIKPTSDDERSALDIARVENIQVYGDPNRILPALKESERAMPHDYIASLRVAQMESAAGHHDQAIAACDRGLARGPGANGRAWLLRIRAEALLAKGQKTEARQTLQKALQVAQTIPTPKGREMNINMISDKLKALEQIPK